MSATIYNDGRASASFTLEDADNTVVTIDRAADGDETEAICSDCGEAKLVVAIEPKLSRVALECSDDDCGRCFYPD